jgi:hypothetical protein
MANTDQYILEQAYTDTLITMTGFNSLASGSWVKGGTAITGGLLDQYGRWSFSLKVGGTTVAGDYLTLYGLPINADGSTYGDGVSAGATLPGGQYILGTCFVAAGITSGNVIVGSIPFIMPERSFLFGVANNTSVALSSTASTGGISNYATFRDNLNV